MSKELRWMLFMLLIVPILLFGPIALGRLGLVPAPNRRPAAEAPQAGKPDPAEGAEGAKAVAKAEGAEKAADPDKTAPAEKAEVAEKAKAEGVAAAKPGEAPADKAEAAAPKPADKPAPPRIKLFEPSSRLTIGGLLDKSDSGYQLEVRLDQKAAGVAWAASSRFDAEFVGGKPNKDPLMLIDPDRQAPPSFSLIWIAPEKPEGAAAAAAANGDDEDAATTLEADQIAMDARVWDVVLDPQGSPVRKIQRDAPGSTKIDGEEISFTTHVDELDVDLRQTYRIWKGENGFEFNLSATSPHKKQKIVYRLMGPHGIPIEGEWYTTTFRDVTFGQLKDGRVTLSSRSAAEVVKGSDNRQTVPLKFSGVEDQYFAVMLEPVVAKNAERFDAETEAIVIHDRAPETQKADVTVSILSKPISLNPGAEAVHSYRVFAGPKTQKALAPYGAEGLAIYRKGYTFWGLASFMASSVITPLLHKIYNFTAWVGSLFGGKAGNYGISIILLTITVRLCLFPLGRKQAISAKRMQDLQPHLTELKEKYKDDKEKLTQATFALYREHKLNPFAGCLPALIQLPIFMGLWQALNGSVELRHSPFLPFFIRDLSAPDMLFKIPFTIPFVSGFLGPFFNLLPFIVMALMMVQTKLFAPPPANAEAEMQQKMMKYMMIVMAFMFYKVPSGLGLYFITSSLWGIGERLLLPKLAAKATLKPAEDADDDGFGGDDRSDGNGRRPKFGGGSDGGGWLSRKMQQILEEAANDSTHRNSRNSGEERRRSKVRSSKRG